MIEYYAEVRAAHVVAVIASGSLFFLRGLAVSAGRTRWALAPPVRYLSYAIDTTLLTAALMLFSMLPSAVFSNGWLAVKLALLPAYVGLGWMALRRGPGSARQRWLFAAALAVFGLMYVIARTHDPLGPLHALLGR